ncbi:MAG: molybdopterin-dependent oxidoreductase [Actinomycetota bacterium]
MVLALILIYMVATLLPLVAYPPSRLAAFLRDHTPGNLATKAIETGVHVSRKFHMKFLEHAALAGLGVSVHIGTVIAGGFAAIAINRPAIPKAKARRALFVLVGGFAIISLLALGSAESLNIPTIITYLIAATVFARASSDAGFGAFFEPDIKEGEMPLDAIRRSRRRFLRGTLAAVVGFVVGGLLVSKSRRSKVPVNASIVKADFPFEMPPAEVAFDKIDGLSPEFTSNDDFYNVDINIIKPVVNHETWTLKIRGLVDDPYELDYRTMQTSFPVVEMAHTLSCISNEVGGDLISTSVWRGVRLKDVLQRAKVKDSAIELIFRAAEGYSDSITIDKAMEDTTLLVFGMDSKPLPREHGFPARLIVPGIYGMKNVKWLKEIEATDQDYQGYWQVRGWSDVARVKTQSRIDVPFDSARAAPDSKIAGIAWAGNRRIMNVEVSEDGGSTWRPAVLKRELSPVAWRLWAADIKPGRTGTRKVMVRATDGEGSLQDPNSTKPHPNGASGYDSAIFFVE